MDYHGQKLSENIYYILTILFGGIAWIAGYIQGDFTVTFYGWLVGLGISLVVIEILFSAYCLCIPDWPMFNRNPVTWLDEIGQANSTPASVPVVASGKSKSKQNKNDKEHTS